jgi:hypothetical protein
MVMVTYDDPYCFYGSSLFKFVSSFTFSKYLIWPIYSENYFNVIPYPSVCSWNFRHTAHSMLLFLLPSFLAILFLFSLFSLGLCFIARLTCNTYSSQYPRLPTFIVDLCLFYCCFPLSNDDIQPSTSVSLLTNHFLAYDWFTYSDP